MIFDCFSYLDEDLLLEIRLNILNDHVDYFVIVEGNKTWQNNPKKLKFDIDKFDKFKKKIIYVPVEDLPSGPDPYLRENFQRNCILRGLNNSSENDLIVVSDLDEIPNPNAIKSFNSKLKYAAFRQRHYYYKFNLQSEKNPYWIGSRICVKKFLKSPQWLRQLKFKKRPFWRIDKIRLNNIIEDGGWHFCNLKNPEELLYKYKNLCETKDPIHFKEEISQEHLSIAAIKNKILYSKDVIGRNDSFKKVAFDSSFPEYIIKNQLKYKKWIDL